MVHYKLNSYLFPFPASIKFQIYCRPIPTWNFCLFKVSKAALLSTNIVLLHPLSDIDAQGNALNCPSFEAQNFKSFNYKQFYKKSSLES